METLRFTTAGSVDDGKSTLIGRLLLESKALYQDQLEAVRRDSERRGYQGLDLSLFTDGLRDEREQKITIDVAYRYFSTPKRKFIIADCPGHLQYTRNMVTGASTSELAVILVDARHGLLTQSKRHAFLSTLLGLPHLVVAVNKMDLVDFDEKIYARLCRDFTEFARKLEVRSLSFLPISALHGDNVVDRSPRMPWYEGSTLLNYLETVNVGATRNVLDFRFPVQVVIRPHQDYRGYAGRIVSGRIAVGEEVVVLPSGVTTSIAAIDVYQDSRPSAKVGNAVVLRLADQVDAGRGDLIVRRNNLPTRSECFDAVVCWLGSAPLDLRKSYRLLHGARQLSVKIEALNYRIDVDTMGREPASHLDLNDIGRVRLVTAEPLFFDPYRQNRDTGSFLLVDPISHDTVAAGMIRGSARHFEELSYSQSPGEKNARVEGESQGERNAVGWGEGESPEHEAPAAISGFVESQGSGAAGSAPPQAASTKPFQAKGAAADDRAKLFGHRSAVVWFTGLSGAGKTTLARSLEQALLQRGVRTFMVDGDGLRHGLCDDLGFSHEARGENLRRAAHLARLAWQQGMIVIGSLISPFAADRAKARALISEGEFFEVHIHCPIDVCRQRDPKGLYAKVDSGQLKDFTGIDSPYEAPQNPELSLDTSASTVLELTQTLIDFLTNRGIL